VSYARRALTVAWKDLAVERRSKETLNALVFFSLLLLFVFQFTLGGDRERLAAVLPGVLWLGFVLSALLALGRTFLVEREHDCWEGLLLAPGDKSAIYLGKLAGNLALMLVVEALVLGLFVVFFDIDLGRALPGLLVVVLLGTLGLAAVGTLFAAMTANVRARELLFPVLLLPVQVPVLLATVKATEALLLAPGDKSAIYLGKLAGNLALMLVVEALVLGLFVVFFDIDLGRALPGLLVVVLLGTLGLAAVGTLFAAMTANVRARELLFPVLLLPVQVPVLLATVKATEALLLGEPLGAVAHWVKLLVAADVIYVVVSLLTFDVVLEG